MYPWYYLQDGEALPWLQQVQTCADRSDQVFRAGSRCPPAQLYLEIHNTLFPDNPLTGSWLEARTAEAGYTSSWGRQRYDPKYADPHGCWASCSAPGPECVACTNPAHFPCLVSGTCIHPSLVCDGHPQVELPTKVWAKGEMVEST